MFTSLFPPVPPHLRSPVMLICRTFVGMYSPVVCFTTNTRIPHLSHDAMPPKKPGRKPPGHVRPEAWAPDAGNNHETVWHQGVLYPFCYKGGTCKKGSCDSCGLCNACMCQCKGTSREKLKNRSSSAPATSAPSSSPAPVALHRKSRRSTQKEVDHAGPSEHEGLVFSSEDESGPPPATPSQNVQGQLGNEMN